MKFGGTSVRDAPSLKAVVEIIAERSGAAALVVVSAAAGVTRGLLEAGRSAAAAGWDEADLALTKLESRHRETLRCLQLADAEGQATGRELDDLFARIGAVVREVATAGGYSRRAQDAVISFGERLSSTLLAAAVRRAGLPLQRVDAAEVVITDDHFRNARPDFATIERRAREIIAPSIAAGKVVITEGFIGASGSGAPTTMGFEASDLSASLLGAALGAEEIQIWTDVPGMLTTGHPAVKRPRRVPRLSYDEAAELALFGAKVLHPETVAPARSRNVPVRILHTADPAGPGTWIGAAEGAAEEAPRVKAIAVAEDPADDSFAGVRAALRLEHTGGWHERAIVCPVGTGIGSSTAVITEIRAALAGVPASMPLSERPHAVPVAVPRERVAEAVVSLHEALLPADPAG